MRKQLRFKHSESMFGHTYAYELPDQPKVTVLENHEFDWRENHTRVNQNYYWFRAPKITQDQLRITMQGLCDLASPFELKVWHSDRGLDASLKMSDLMDATSWAWSHTEMWSKWSPEQEKEWVQSNKPRKLKVRKDGSIQVRVTVSEIENP